MNASCQTCCKHCPKCEQEAKELEDFERWWKGQSLPPSFKARELKDYLERLRSQ